MQTEDIILWVDKAIEVREASYISPPENSDHRIKLHIGKYTKTEAQCIEETKPKEAKDYDRSIAFMLIGYGNDITDWKKEIEEDRLIESYSIKKL